MINPIAIPSTSATPANSNNSCPVCQKTMSQQRIVVTPCNHRYHEECISNHLNPVKNPEQRTCVTCGTIAVPLVREMAPPVGKEESNGFIEPAELRAVRTGQRESVAKMLSTKPEIVNQCFHRGVSGESGEKVHLLYIAAMEGDSDMLSLLLNAKAKINTTQSIAGHEENGWTALMVAAQKGHTGVVARLLKAGAKVEAPSKGMKSPLYIAVQNGHTEVARLLCANKANLETVQRDEAVDQTALMAAVRAGKTDMVRILLNAGAKMESPSKSTDSPLFSAISRGYIDIVKLFLEAIQAKPKTRSMVNAFGSYHSEKNPCTALMVAVLSGHTEIAGLLINAGAEVNACQKDGSTALHQAARLQEAELLQLLIDHKAKIDVKLKTNGVTPLHLSINSSLFKCTEALIKNGANINAIRTPDGATAVHMAVQLENLQSLQALIDARANLDLPLKTDGATALHFAAIKGSMPFLTALISAKANPNVKTSTDGDTPIDLARFHDNPECVNALEIAMGNKG